MSAIINALRQLVAWLNGQKLVLFDATILRFDLIQARVHSLHEARRVARALRSFDSYPPEAWAAP